MAYIIHLVPTSKLRPISVPSFSIDEQVSMQVHKLLGAISRKRGYVHTYCSIYFQTFNQSLPIINEKDFYRKLVKGEVDRNSHYGSLLLGMFLITYLTPRLSTDSGESVEELYLILKSIFSLLQSTGKVTLELIQLGVLIASWEHCQALHQESWITIGGCIRVAHILGLHTCVRQVPTGDESDKVGFEVTRCVWWCVVVLERSAIPDRLCVSGLVLIMLRVINQEYMDSKLPFASNGPTPDDYLPLVPLNDGINYHIRDEVLLPEDLDLLSTSDLKAREFTRFGSFAPTIQMTYLSDLTTRHILDKGKCPESREADSVKLDIALQHFSGACIPPP